MVRTSCILAAVLLAFSPRSEARPWSVTDIAPFTAGIDTIEVASNGAVLFNDHDIDLKHDSVEQTWLILASNSAIREIPRRFRIAELHWAPDCRRPGNYGSSTRKPRWASRCKMADQT